MTCIAGDTATWQGAAEREGGQSRQASGAVMAAIHRRGVNLLGSELSPSFSRQRRIFFLRARLGSANAFAAAQQETETGKAAPEEREGPRFRYGFAGRVGVRWLYDEGLCREPTPPGEESEAEQAEAEEPQAGRFGDPVGLGVVAVF